MFRFLKKFMGPLRLSIAVLILSSGLSSTLRAAPLEDAKMGLAALVRGDYEKAVLLNTRAIQTGALERESLAIAYYNRGMGYQKLQKPDLAIKDFKQAYESWPEHPLTQEKMRGLGLFDKPQDKVAD